MKQIQPQTISTFLEHDNVLGVLSSILKKHHKVKVPARSPYLLTATEKTVKDEVCTITYRLSHGKQVVFEIMRELSDNGDRIHMKKFDIEKGPFAHEIAQAFLPYFAANTN